MSEKLDLSLSNKDKSSIAHTEEHNMTCKFLRHQETLRFNVGDVLIRQERGWSDDAKWNTIVVSHVSQVPKKYVYIYENPQGVGFIKQLKANGKGLCDHVTCLADLDTDHVRYLVDPDYQDHLLIGDTSEYTYEAQFKEEQARKRAIDRDNKKLVENTSTWAKANELAAKLKKGDKIWIGMTMFEAAAEPATVTKVTKKKVSEVDRWQKPESDGTSQLYYTVHVNQKTTWGQHDYEYHTDDLVRHKVFVKKPKSYQKEI